MQLLAVVCGFPRAMLEVPHAADPFDVTSFQQVSVFCPLMIRTEDASRLLQLCFVLRR